MTAPPSGTRWRSAEYLNEVMPDAGLLPADRIQRAHCRSICGEIHSGFTTLRASLPVNLKGHFPGFKIWSRAQADIDRVCTIWRECLAESGGPFLFGERTMADAMYAPVVTRFMTYDVKLEPGLRPTPAPSWRCPRCRNGSRPPRPSPPTSRSSRSNIRQAGAPCLLEGLRQRAGPAQAGASRERRAAAPVAFPVFRRALNPDSRLRPSGSVHRCRSDRSTATRVARISHSNIQP